MQALLLRAHAARRAGAIGAGAPTRSARQQQYDTAAPPHNVAAIRVDPPGADPRGESPAQKDGSEEAKGGTSRSRQ